MKLPHLLAVAFFAVTAASGADLGGVKSVYFLPMSGGLDQYLAVQLANSGQVQVVTDPTRADAIFSDRIGENFQTSVDDLYGLNKKKDDENTSGEFTRPAMQPLSRGKGSIFLVDRETRTVLWSTFATGDTYDAKKMNKLAGKIAKRFRKDLSKETAGEAGK